MNQAHIKAILEGVVPELKAAIASATKPLSDRIEALEKREVGKGEKGDPGTSVTLDDVRPLIVETLAEWPKPENGKDADPAVIEQMVAEAVAKIPAPQDGKSVTVDDVRPLIEEAVAAIPVPKDGKDGVGLAGAVIDRSGELVVTLSDGSHHSLGPVVGKDGAPGKDGLGFEHMEETLEDGGRVVVRRYRRGEEVQEFRHVTATVIDRGVWKQGPYQRGDSVSHGGSTWIAQKDTETKPDTPDSDWRLSAKRGRDGKDFRPDVPRDPQPVKFR